MNRQAKNGLGILCAAAIVWSGIHLARHYWPEHEKVAFGEPASVPPQTIDAFAPFTVLRKPIPAPAHLTFSAADGIHGEVLDQELVLGVHINGQARAYPIDMLTGALREIINDTVGGIAIAATW